MGNFIGTSSPSDGKSGAQSNRVYSKRAGDLGEESDLLMKLGEEGEYSNHDYSR